MNNPETDIVLARLEAAVAEHGYAVITTESDGSPFSYTVGRAALGRPELLVTGLHDPNVAGTLLNVLAELDASTPLSPGDLIQPGQVVSGFAAGVIAADPAAADMKAARAFAQARSVELTALQLLWPDAEGNLPGSELYVLESRDQPVFALSEG